MPALLCVLEMLLGVAILALILWVIWWAVTSILAAFGVGIDPRGLIILKVILVLVLLIALVSILARGDLCTLMPLFPRR